MKVIVFNGPPNCGKDEAVAFLRRKYSVPSFSFKRSLKNITLQLYCVTESQWDSWYTREGKELPRKELGGLSCRQAFIKVSEEIIKPNFGMDYFGKAEAFLLQQLHKDSVQVVVCGDGGFNEEIKPLITAFGAENIFIVQLHRPGCSFNGDSRNWIDLEDIPEQNYITIFNDRRLEDYHEDLEDVYKYVTDFFN